MNVEKLLVVLGTFVAAAYLIIGIVGGLWPSHWSDDAAASDQIIWFVLLVGGGLLLYTGLRVSRRAPWIGAALISVGAVAGSLPIFWTLIALAVAAALVVLSLMYALRASGTALATD